MKANFKVQHDVLSGLKYLQVVKRKGVRVGKDEEMIVRPIVKFRENLWGKNLISGTRGHIHPTQRRSQYTRRNVRTLQTPKASVLTGYVVASDEAPSGMLARGHYDAVCKFVDDDDQTHLKFEWSFDISKDWK